MPTFSIGLTAALMGGGCGLVLDLGGEADPDAKLDGSVDGDGGVVSGDAASGSRDGSVWPSDGSVAVDATGRRDATAATDGASGSGDGAVPLIDAGPCVDDTREDDDDIAQAMAGGLVTGIVPGLVTFDMTSCPEDDDLVYAYSDCCEDARGAVVMYDPSHGRVVLEMRDEYGVLWPRAATETMPGRLELLSRGDGGYFYAVVRNASGTPVPYTLTVYAPVYAM